MTKIGQCAHKFGMLPNQGVSEESHVARKCTKVNSRGQKSFWVSTGVKILRVYLGSPPFDIFILGSSGVIWEYIFEHKMTSFDCDRPERGHKKGAKGRLGSNRVNLRKTDGMLPLRFPMWALVLLSTCEHKCKHVTQKLIWTTKHMFNFL